MTKEYARDLLARIPAEWGWRPGRVEPSILKRCPGGITVGCISHNELTLDRVLWFKEGGYFAATATGYFDRANKRLPFEYLTLCPLAECTNTDRQYWYHATPYQNWESIRMHGLFSAHKASRFKANASTTQRIDSRYFIYVSLSITQAIEWAQNEKLLGGVRSRKEWAILELDAIRIGCTIYDDPMSTTGYILADDEVCCNCVKLHSEFTRQ